MKLIGRRAWILFIICLLFFAGLIFFIITYIQDAPTWASSIWNKHIFENGQLVNAGKITDVNNEVLAHSEDGERRYSDDEETREAMMHLVGDNNGNVSTALQVTYRDKLVGWNFFTGIYSAGDRIGNTIISTVDADLNRVAYSVLNGRRGTIGIMNYETGELICMASSPSFDPSYPPNIEDDPERYDGAYINRFLSAKYTPGSIYKLVTATAALNEISDIKDTTFECEGQITIEGGIITCVQAHGSQNFSETLVNSCNVAFAEMAVEIGSSKMTKYSKDAGLNTALSMGNINATTGVFDLKKADDLALAWAGVGQYETLINPLSYLKYVASIANNGKYVSPKVIDSIKTEGGIPTSFDIGIPGGNSMDTTTARYLQKMMRSCVTDNYGEGGLEGYKMSGKTGTAEVGEGNDPHSWFCGFLDSNDEPLAFIAIVENGGAGNLSAYDLATTVLREAVN